MIPVKLNQSGLMWAQSELSPSSQLCDASAECDGNQMRGKTKVFGEVKDSFEEVCSAAVLLSSQGADSDRVTGLPT